jgi:kynureninase
MREPRGIDWGVSLTTVRQWDAEDPLRGYRDRFELPAGLVYLDGNSLGALTTAARERVERVTRGEWGEGLIRSWNAHHWIEAPERVGDKIARLIGAGPNEVIACDSTSVNLFKLVSAALRARPSRRTVLSEPGNFPTDLYVIEGAIADGRCRLRLEPAERILEAIDEDTAVVVLTHVHYKSAAMHDMAAITRRAHERGAFAIWDLSHSAGAVEVEVDRWGVDMAVGCGYKYLNGGPGAPAFLFVAHRHQEALSSPLSGWMGHAAPFEFVDEYRPAGGLRRFLCGTPPVLGLAALEASVDTLLECGMPRIVAKSRYLSRLFIELVESMCPDAGLELVSPRDPERRGSHVSFRHPHGYALVQALIERNVIGDFRAPDILRFGFAPLYTRYEDVWIAARTLADVFGSDCWRAPKYAIRAAVT